MRLEINKILSQENQADIERDYNEVKIRAKVRDQVKKKHRELIKKSKELRSKSSFLKRKPAKKFDSSPTF